MTPTRYIDHEGREVEVRQSLIFGGWIAMARTNPYTYEHLAFDGWKYAQHPAPEAAQTDLDDYARREGWKVVEG